MTQGEIASVFKDTMMTAFLMSAPFLLATAAIGVLISIFQAATQINEQNIGFVFKILAVGIMLVVLFSWLMTTIMDFTGRTFEAIGNFL